MRKTLSAMAMMLGLLLSTPASAQSIGTACGNPSTGIITRDSSASTQGVIICAQDASGQTIWEPIGQGLPSYDQGQTCENVGQFRYNTSTNMPQYCNSAGRWTGFSASEFQPNQTAGTASSYCTAMTDANGNPYIIQNRHTWPGTIYFYQDSHEAVLCNLTGGGLSIMAQYGASELYPWQ